jgi:hypothetical protein
MSREAEMLESLIGDLIDHPPPGVAPDEIEAWLRAHQAELIATVQRACNDRSGHYYEVDGTWYVDDQFLQNLAARHETLPMRADWEIVLPQGALRCRVLRGQSALPGQIGVLYACEPVDSLEFPAQLHRWAQEQGLARFEGQWSQWPGATTTPLKTSSNCGCAGAPRSPAPGSHGCGCTACKARHAEDHA